MKKYYTLFTVLLTATCAGAQNITDEYQTYDDNRECIYRHVVNYNAAKERASETVFKKEKLGEGSWSNEKQVDRGVYTYEYDRQGRLTMKQLKYENDELDSYRIYVTYTPDETIYKHYSLTEWDTRFKSIWGVYVSGEQSLASTNDRDSYDRNYVRYDRQGNVVERGSIYKEDDEIELFPERIYKWSDLEETIDQRIDGNKETKRKYFRYDENTKLIEYWEITLRHEDDGYRVVYAYDDLGRIVSRTKYRIDWNDDENDIVDTEIQGNHAPRKESSYTPEDFDESKYSWVLEEREEYAYATDEVYSLTSGWYNEFGYCGPIAECKHCEYDEYDEVTETSLLFHRDANGKLLSAEMKSNDPYMTQPVISVDENGHITSVVLDHNWYDELEDGSIKDYGHEHTETIYTWEGENLVRVDYNEEYKNPWDEGSYTDSYTYAYGNGKIEMHDQYSTKTLEKDGNRIKLTETGSYYKYYVIAERQTEDVRFVLARPFEETRELGLDSIKVLSRKGRVVHASSYRWNDDEMYLIAGDTEGGYMLCPNMSADEYFHIVKEGNVAYCYDIEDRLCYVIDGERLMKEIDYADEVSNVVVGSKAPGIDPSSSCTIREYIYDANGNLVGIKVSKQDSNGNVSEEYALSYTYDAASGIESISTASGFELNGRTLGTSSDMSFTICDLNGRTIATDVNSFTFTQSGVYVMKTGSKSVKIYVK